MPARSRAWAIALVLTAASLAFLPLVDWSNPVLRHNDNPSLLEARSLLEGKIALSERAHDTALIEDRIVNIFQPGQTLFFLIHLGAIGDSALKVFQIEMFLVFFASVALFGLAMFKLSGERAVLSVALPASLMFGAPYIASLPLTLVGSVYRVNHCLSIGFIVGLLALLGHQTWHRKLLLIGVCIGGAVLFRAQNLLLLFLPLSMLLQNADGRSWRVSESLSTPAARKALALQAAKLLVFPLLAMIIITGFQIARFHNPFESGYASIYAGRDDYLAQRANTYGLFSWHFLPENLYRTLGAIPKFELDGGRIVEIIGDPRGNSLLFTQPILLLIPLLWRGLKNARAQSFAASALLLAIPVWLYHNPGFFAPGYMRLSLDYLPLWIALMAVCARYTPKSKYLIWPALLLTVWAIGYGILFLRIGVSV